MNSRIGFRASFRVWVLAVALAAVSCVTPTLPPDDPPAPIVELGNGVARLRGDVGEGPSFVLVHNRASGLVFGQRTETGAYDFEVQTERCDLLALWYSMGTYQSTSVLFRPGEIDGNRGSCRASAEAEADDEPSDEPDASTP